MQHYNVHRLSGFLIAWFFKKMYYYWETEKIIIADLYTCHVSKIFCVPESIDRQERDI